MAVINPRIYSVHLKVVGAERARAKGIRVMNILDFSLLVAFCRSEDLSSSFHELLR